MRRIAGSAVLLCTIATAITAQGTSIRPQNDQPNPYKTIEGWAKLPEGRTWGSTSAVSVDRDGASIWVAERCGANSCIGSKLAAVLKFDANGNVVKSFGEGMFISPHGILADRDGNIWVVDCACTARGAPDTTKPAMGHQIFKFNTDGKLLMTLGTPGGAREPGYFFQPNAILVAPNGTIFVAEGHASSPGATARVMKFSKDGKLIGSWGKLGAGPGEFNQPHALAMDSKGRLFVGDRANNRIMIFDQDMKLLDTWLQFGRPSGIFIDKDDNIYVADSESGSIAKDRTAWLRGIRIGSAKDGVVKYFIPDPNPAATGTSAAEGVTVDAKGNIYGAEVGPKALKKYIKR